MSRRALAIWLAIIGTLVLGAGILAAAAPEPPCHDPEPAGVYRSCP